MDGQVFFDKFAEGIIAFAELGNWAFIAAFMVWSWIFGMASGRIKINVKFINNIPKAYFVILQGVILAVIWAYLFDFTTKEQFAELFISIIIGMVCWKLGLSKIGSKVESKLARK